MTAPHRPEDDVRRPPPPVAWERVRKVHLMGVGGSAMGALAGLLRALGYEVRGSDRGVYPPMSTFLAERGIEVMEGYRAENLAWGPDVVVVGNVIRPDYEEAVALRARGIPHCSLPQALAALVIRDRLSVVITGTHGKTTTSSLTAWLLETAGRDPAFLIGGVTGNFDSNFKAGAGDVFVVEGDEYDTAYFDKGPKFLHYRPRVASINNVEFDHADIFPDLDAIVRAFARFAELLPPDGRLVVNGADGRALTAASACDAPIWTFGRDGAYDVAAIGLAAGADGTRFTLRLPGYEERDAFLPLWGAHNVENALTASGLALAAGAVPDAILAGLATFRPPRKRLEVRGVARDVPVIDDFGHHPTAIRETLRAVRARYPGRRVLALFEVQSNTARRRVFQRDFADAFAGADRVWFGRPLEKASDSLAPEARLDLDELVRTLVAGGTPAEIIRETDALAETVAAEARSGEDVVVAMSGRDFDGVHGKILAALERGA